MLAIRPLLAESEQETYRTLLQPGAIVVLRGEEPLRSFDLSPWHERNMLISGPVGHQPGGSQRGGDAERLGERRGTGLVVWDARCLPSRTSSAATAVGRSYWALYDPRHRNRISSSVGQTSASWAASPIRAYLGLILDAMTLCCPILGARRARCAHRGCSGVLSQRMLGAMLAQLGHCLTRVIASGCQCADVANAWHSRILLRRQPPLCTRSAEIYEQN